MKHVIPHTVNGAQAAKALPGSAAAARPALEFATKCTCVARPKKLPYVAVPEGRGAASAEFAATRLSIRDEKPLRESTGGEKSGKQCLYARNR